MQRNWETPKSISLNLVLMFNRTYAKLAWVYAKEICSYKFNNNVLWRI